MIPSYLVPLANHLWQSTVFVAIIALLTLMLRQNRAALRHWLWLSASLKFLLPFSLLIAVGSRFEWKTSARTPPPLAIGMTEVSEPFTPEIYDLRPVVYHTPAPPDHWPIVLFSLWMLGVLASLAPSVSQWRRISKTWKAGRPLELGLPIPALSCIDNSEPGVFGILQPVLHLPDGITDKLKPAELKALLAHELCHVRRRDNLANVLHIVVETVFWFHPLVWWIERSMIAEQENACDEEVLRLGNNPQAYAEGILKVCRHYLASRLACVARITGSDLRKRVERIMSEQLQRRLSLAKAVLLLGVGIGTLSIPVIHGAMHSTHPTEFLTQAVKTASFEVATVKRHGPDGVNGVLVGGSCHGVDSKYPPGRYAPPPQGRCVFTRMSLTNLINAAYFPAIFTSKPRKFAGGQPWTENEFWDVQAKAEDTDNVTESQLKDMLKALLRNRFNIQFHLEESEIRGYALVVSKSGLKIKPDTSDQPTGMHATGEDYNFTKWPMSQFAQYITRSAGAQVVDKTGLTDGYTFSFHMPPPLSTAPDAPPGGDFRSSLFTVLEEQLGLRLESQKVPIDIIVIDSAEKPAQDASEIRVLASNDVAEATSSKTARAQVAPESNLAFEVASVRLHVFDAPGSTGRTGIEEDPGLVRIENLSLNVLISISYGLKGRQQLVGPGWLNTVTYDIDAKPPAGYKREQLQYLLRNLLTDRFKLKVHHETRLLPAFALVVAKRGPKLRESAGPRTYHTGRQGLVEGNQMSTDQLVDILTNLLGVRVIKQTGLRAMYDVKLEWTPDAPPQPPTGADTRAAPELELPLLTALQEQLGLRLESKKLPADVVFVDHIERAPIAN